MPGWLFLDRCQYCIVCIGIIQYKHAIHLVSTVLHYKYLKKEAIYVIPITFMSSKVKKMFDSRKKSNG